MKYYIFAVRMKGEKDETDACCLCSRFERATAMEQERELHVVKPRVFKRRAAYPVVKTNLEENREVLEVIEALKTERAVKVVTMARNDAEIAENKAKIARNNALIAENEAEIAELRAAVARNNERIARNDAIIARLERRHQILRTVLNMGTMMLNLFLRH